jgi:hypothetical protein
VYNWLNMLVQSIASIHFGMFLTSGDVNQMSINAIRGNNSMSEEVNQGYPIKKVSTLLFI